MKRIGVLGFQGSFLEHQQMLESMHIKTQLVISKSALSEIDGLVIPGGESTTFIKLLKFNHLFDELSQKIQEGMPILATCAGVILLASQIDNVEQESMKQLSVQVNRNGYGPQIFSFCETISIEGLQDPFKAVFIRAPIITKVMSPANVIARDSYGNPVMIQEKNRLGLTFHPELTDDQRIHEMFIQMI